MMPPSLGQAPVPGNLQRLPLMMSPASPRLTRPVLPADRSLVEKMVDFVVGDGPNNRYALICCFCHCHNGMALKDEFEYLSFKCCYCGTYNPARKMRPFAPRIVSSSLPPQPVVEEPESESEKTDSTDRTEDGPKEQLQQEDTQRPEGQQQTEAVLKSAEITDDEDEEAQAGAEESASGEETVGDDKL